MKLLFQALAVFCLLLFAVSSTFAQRVHWPVGVEDTYLDRGLGVPGVWSYKYSEWGIAYEREGTDNAKLKKKDKDPGIIHLTYAPLDIQQVCVVESFNPGALAKVEIGYYENGSKKLTRQTIYDGSEEERHTEWRVRNFTFDKVEKVTDIWLHVNYVAVPGPNQYAGVAICESAIPYEPDWNLPDEELFTDDILDINDDVSGLASPKGGAFLSANMRYIYFPHENSSGYDVIWRGTIGSDGKLTEVRFSDFNLPYDVSSASALAAVAQDGNIAYVNSMDLDKFRLFKVYQSANLFGKLKWKYEKEVIPGYTNKSQYLDFVMSYDGNIVIAAFDPLGDKSPYGRDMYVSIRSPKGKWSDFKRMGDDINSTEVDLPCFLAADNKTLYFSSRGRIGYGEGDIYVSRRLDDSWTSWSEPVNLGPKVNSEEHENAFVIDAKAEFAYFTRYKESRNEEDESDIFRIRIRQPKPEPPAPDLSVGEEEEVIETKSIVPEPVVLITGRVTNKATGEPLQAEVVYEDITSGELLGTAMSNAQTGEYAIILQKGVHYSFEAQADKFLSDRYSLNTAALTQFVSQERDFALPPIQKGESIVLNNIFFETGKAELLPESFLELEKLVSVMKEYSKLVIEIGGHTDDVGQDTYNETLSQNRAQAVVDFLLEKGIKTERMSAKGYGESQPIADNQTEEGRAQNRRVEFSIVED